MLEKKRRLARDRFTALLSRPDLLTVYNRIGTLKYISSGRSFSVVTSGKHEKRAVARNRLRRRLYNLFQRSKTPLSGILYASKQSYSFEYSDITTLFYELLEKVRTSSKEASR